MSADATPPDPAPHDTANAAANAVKPHLAFMLGGERFDITPSDIEPAPAFGTHIRTLFMQGMAKVQGEWTIMLSVDDVLALEATTHEVVACEAPEALPA